MGTINSYGAIHINWWQAWKEKKSQMQMQMLSVNGTLTPLCPMHAATKQSEHPHLWSIMSLSRSRTMYGVQAMYVQSA